MALNEQEAIREPTKQMGLRTAFVPRITGQPGGKVSTTFANRAVLSLCVVTTQCLCIISPKFHERTPSLWVDRIFDIKLI